MEVCQRDVLEAQIRDRITAGDPAGATTVALRGYGTEILRFLVVIHGDESRAMEAFSLFSEGVWRGIEAFDWRCTFRTWAYGVARRSSLRLRRDAGRRARREIPLDALAAISAIEDHVRTSTLSFLRTEPRNRFAEIRNELPPDDRALLVLRVDRELSWKECVHAMADVDASRSPEELAREAARLRKRFQVLKQRLLEIGQREGLVRSSV